MKFVMLNYVLLFVSAFIAGTMNSVAGGGSFFSFPALVFTGVDIKLANATNAVALWPGSVASVGAYRRELRTQREAVKLLAGVSLVGGLLGALLLLYTPSEVLDRLLPYLLLGATLLFAYSPQITALLRGRQAATAGTSDGASVVALRKEQRNVVLLQFAISIYGGFFGGGIGILMLAALAIMGLQNIHEMNAIKTFMATLINGIAVVTFAIAGQVVWPLAVLMAVGATLGGYGGAAYARRLDPKHVRTFVVVVGLVMSLYLFVRPYLASL